MTHPIKTIISSFALFAMSVSASQANADTYRHIQGLALDIQLKADALMGETHHYVHTPRYREMIRNISSMRARAVRVHVLSLQHGCLIAMREELRVLDTQFHIIESIFDSAEVEASHGHGHIHGPTRHVKEHLKCIENDIHHILDDITQMTRVGVRSPYSAGVRSSGYRGVQVYRSHPRSRVQHVHGGHGHGRGHSGHRNQSNLRYNSRAGIHYSTGGLNIRIGF